MTVYGPDHCIKIEFRFTMAGEQCLNTHYVTSEFIPTTADCQSAAETAVNWWTTNMRALQSVQLTLREVYAVSLHAANGPEYTVPVSEFAQGTVSGDALPNNCSLAISFRTGQSGRSYRGRVYQLGLAESQEAQSLVIGSAAENIRDAWGQLITAMAAEGFTSIVRSTRSGGADRTRAIGTAIQTVILVDTVVDSQRRRLPGRGR